jgi:hypothetical protein
MLIKKHHDLWHRSPYRLNKERKSKEESVKMFMETYDRKALCRKGICASHGLSGDG